ncbi:hypothetical protein ACIQ7D_17780 [Streptomyces sp. NPDC096310]|uniref:hypothetical protein n=1 Tax=Streptomyces sp. NPDC096310 TaxID=3366082 RepID=UPI003820A891
MITTDLRDDLDTITREITALTGRVEIGYFYSPEDQHNTWSRLDNLRPRAQHLADQIAAEDREIQRLADAISATGDLCLGFIGYVIFGPAVLPAPTLYRVQVIERQGGWVVPSSVRRGVTAEQIIETQREILTGVMAYGGHASVWGRAIRDYRIQITAY